MNFFGTGGVGADIKAENTKKIRKAILAQVKPLCRSCPSGDGRVYCTLCNQGTLYSINHSLSLSNNNCKQVRYRVPRNISGQSTEIGSTKVSSAD